MSPWHFVKNMQKPETQVQLSDFFSSQESTNVTQQVSIQSLKDLFIILWYSDIDIFSSAD